MSPARTAFGVEREGDALRRQAVGVVAEDAEDHGALGVVDELAAEAVDRLADHHIEQAALSVAEQAGEAGAEERLAPLIAASW